MEKRKGVLPNMDTQLITQNIQSTQGPSLEERYRLFNRIVDEALFKYHPDHYRGDRPEQAERMTRKLISVKRIAREVYQGLRNDSHS